MSNLTDYEFAILLASGSVLVIAIMALAMVFWTLRQLERQ